MVDRACRRCRWTNQHATEDALGLGSFDEDDLYEALDWLATQQVETECCLYQSHAKQQGRPPVLVLHDVISNYFKGACNEVGR